MAPRRIPARFTAFFLSFTLLLTACASVRLVPAYDEQIDNGLTELYADTSGFVDRMPSDSSWNTPTASPRWISS